MTMKHDVTRWAPLGLALVLVAGIAATQQAPARIGLVNLQVLMEQTPGYQEARDAYLQEFQGYEQEMTQLQAQLDSMIRAYDQQQVVLSPTAKTEKESEIRQFQQRVQARAGELDNLTNSRQRELLQPLEDRVQAVIEGIRAERNIAVVFDIAQASNIVAADRTLDITGTVVQRLQSSGQ